MQVGSVEEVWENAEKGRFGEERKCEAGAGHARGMVGSCPRLILVAVVLWRF